MKQLKLKNGQKWQKFYSFCHLLPLIKIFSLPYQLGLGWAAAVFLDLYMVLIRTSKDSFVRELMGLKISIFFFMFLKFCHEKMLFFTHFLHFKVVFSIQKQFKHVQNVFFLSPECICCDMKVSEPFNNLSGRNENFFRKIVTNCDQDLELCRILPMMNPRTVHI